MTEQKIKELAAEYKRLKSFVEVDRSLQKQGVYGFIPSENISSICKFINLFEQKVLGVTND